jgi:hypothetical protein
MDSSVLSQLCGMTIEDSAKEQFQKKTGYKVTSAEYFDVIYPPKVYANSLWRKEFYSGSSWKERKGTRNKHYMLPTTNIAGAWFGYYLGPCKYHAFEYKTTDEMTEQELEIYYAFIYSKWKTFIQEQVCRI